jgi:hypothetical protein
MILDFDMCIWLMILSRGDSRYISRGDDIMTEFIILGI